MVGLGTDVFSKGGNVVHFLVLDILHHALSFIVSKSDPFLKGRLFKRNIQFDYHSMQILLCIVMIPRVFLYCFEYPFLLLFPELGPDLHCSLLKAFLYPQLSDLLSISLNRNTFHSLVSPADNLIYGAQLS